MTIVTMPVASLFLFLLVGLLAFCIALVPFYFIFRLILFPIRFFWGAIVGLLKY